VSRLPADIDEMTAAFDVDQERLRADPRLHPIADELSKLLPIDSRDAFNRYCRVACRSWSEELRDGIGRPSKQFDELLGRVERGGEGVIKTSWGGVVVTLHEHPRVEKFLVVRHSKYLALEKHDQKDERLEVKEGAGLILSRRAVNEPLKIDIFSPGDQFHFGPGMEHCLIGTENLLVFERSIDPKGLDKDLIFIYEPDNA
jgi:hypothetical protein